MRTNIRNLVIQADLNTGTKEEVHSLIDAINNLLSERFPNEQPQIMSSGLEKSDIDTPRIHEEQTREGYIAHINHFIQTETDGTLILSELDEVYISNGANQVKHICKDFIIDENDAVVTFKELSDEDIVVLCEFIDEN